MERKKHDRDVGLVVGSKITAHVRKALRIGKEEKKTQEREPLLGHPKVTHDEEATPNAAIVEEEEGRPRLADVLTYQTTLNLVVYTLLALYTLAYDQVLSPHHSIYPPR